MFVQIHMLQSMPPGNLNRDETGQPKKCVFGGVTRGRISSQCLKHNIRLSTQFKEAFGDALADRTTYLPRMVADQLKSRPELEVPEEELNDLMGALASKFKKEKRESESDGARDGSDEQDTSGGAAPEGDETGQTGQLVFFQQPFASAIAELVGELRRNNEPAYRYFLTGEMGTQAKTKEEKAELKRKKDEFKERRAELKKQTEAATTDEQRDAIKQKVDALEKEDKAEKDKDKKKRGALDADIKGFVQQVFEASKSLTVDIGMFGRMTTSDLVVNVEAACQVAHAISTHETLIESDYFTAMDDRKGIYATSQTDKAGAAFLGSGETETFFNSAVYYKYLNLDVEALNRHLLAESVDAAARAAGVLVAAAALATPTGKQNSFASHSVPELILVEVSRSKRPVSYANAFLQPVEGGAGRNLMTESSKALHAYIDSVAAAFAPADVRRVLLAVGPASTTLQSTHHLALTLDELVKSVVRLITTPEQAEVSA